METVEQLVSFHHIQVQLSGGAPWGFTLKGGLEHGEPLIITKKVLLRTAELGRGVGDQRSSTAAHLAAGASVGAFSPPAAPPPPAVIKRALCERGCEAHKAQSEARGVQGPDEVQERAARRIRCGSEFLECCYNGLSVFALSIPGSFLRIKDPGFRRHRPQKLRLSGDNGTDGCPKAAKKIHITELMSVFRSRGPARTSPVRPRKRPCGRSGGGERLTFRGKCQEGDAGVHGALCPSGEAVHRGPGSVHPLPADYRRIVQDSQR
ncbi:Protein Shroom2 [Takifugu flavidus]|uniref:Protein Shroom2 n=1 Tax=Takifugu flavidus TaxID=433684 RepID=A0A5C6N9T0_9TELE|nr:Protein Shroom2 [Takifugu flavidus]